MQSPVVGACCAFPSENGAPEEIQILPSGPNINTIDGRSFILKSAGALVAKMNGLGRQFVVDYNHQDEFVRKGSGGEAPAAGWMNQFFVKEDGGVYAKVEWTDKARSEIARKEYKYISPTLFYDKDTKEITGFSGVSLVNFPALNLKALCSSIGIQSPNNETGDNALLMGEIATLRAELNIVSHERLHAKRKAALDAIKRNALPMLLLDAMEARCTASGIEDMDNWADSLGNTCGIAALRGMQTVTAGIQTSHARTSLRSDAEREVCNTLGIDIRQLREHKNKGV